MLTLKQQPIVDREVRTISIFNDETYMWEVHSFEFIEFLYNLVTCRDLEKSDVAVNVELSKSNRHGGLEIGKEYWVQMRNVVLENVIGNTACCRDRWDYYFECDISYVKEKKLPPE